MTDTLPPPPNEPDVPLSPEERARLDAAAHQRAEAILVRTAIDPLAVAAENAQLRSAIRGAHALLRVMLERAGGDAFVTFAEHSPQGEPTTVMTVDRAKNGDVHLYLHTPSRAERRAAKKR